MFVDASAIVAIIAREDDWRALALTVGHAENAMVSPLCLWEATVALARNKERSFEDADALVKGFAATFELAVIPITASIGSLAIEASRRYGRGRHPADLNFGDCFAYACARERGVPLLFKGGDFGRTDIPAA